MTETEEHLQSRKDEIFVLSSIYDELRFDEAEVSGSLRIPVELDAPVPVICKERDGKVQFLPGVEFSFWTGSRYPEEQPPQIKLQCSWLPRDRIQQVEQEVQQVWGTTKELCLFSMIDEVSAMAKSAFGMEYLDVDDDLFGRIMQFAEAEELAQFQLHSYFCGVCLERKKGVDCFKLPRCGHIFCKVDNPMDLD
jgi:hypothetical protein